MGINKKLFSLALLALCVSIAILSVPAAKADGEVIKETKISAYLHDFHNTSAAAVRMGATDVPVVGFPGQNWDSTQFGTIFVLDDLLTEGSEITSATVGRLQGIYFISSLDGFNHGTSFSLVFTNKAYNGSTIQLIGSIEQLAGDAGMELSVPSGTGKFRFAKGYAMFQFISSYVSTDFTYTLFHMNLTVRHYI